MNYNTQKTTLSALYYKHEDKLNTWALIAVCVIGLATIAGVNGWMGN